MRAGTEGVKSSTNVTINPTNCNMPSSSASRPKPKLSLNQFKLTATELKELQTHQTLIHCYMSKKVANTSQDWTIIDLQSVYNNMKPP